MSSKATKTPVSFRNNLAFAPKSTEEVASKTLVLGLKLEYSAPLCIHYSKTRIKLSWAYMRCRNTDSLVDMLDVLEWPRKKCI